MTKELYAGIVTRDPYRVTDFLIWTAKVDFMHLKGVEKPDETNAQKWQDLTGDIFLGQKKHQKKKEFFVRFRIKPAPQAQESAA